MYKFLSVEVLLKSLPILVIYHTTRLALAMTLLIWLPKVSVLSRIMPKSFIDSSSCRGVSLSLYSLGNNYFLFLPNITTPDLLKFITSLFLRHQSTNLFRSSCNIWWSWIFRIILSIEINALAFIKKKKNNNNNNNMWKRQHKTVFLRSFLFGERRTDKDFYW